MATVVTGKYQPLFFGMRSTGVKHVAWNQEIVDAFTYGDFNYFS
jgi:hypothetical protein